jgi:hypothetical protein
MVAPPLPERLEYILWALLAHAWAPCESCTGSAARSFSLLGPCKRDILEIGMQIVANGSLYRFNRYMQRLPVAFANLTVLDSTRLLIQMMNRLNP